MLSAFISSLKQALVVFSASLFTGLLLFISTRKIWRRFFGVSRTGSTEKIEEEKNAFRESTFTYEDLAQNLVQSLFSILPIQMAAVYMEDLLKNDFPLRAQIGMKNPLTADLKYNRSGLAIAATNPLMRHFHSNNIPLNMEEIQNDLEMDKTAWTPMVETLKRLEAEICIPLTFGGRVRGLLVMGQKKNHTLFNQDDFDSIDTFVQLGTDIMRFIYGMETELNHTALYSHDMNHNIRALMQAIQFL